ncbi:hypothetical protein FSARC_14447 [Fusarium sarcochroum]|uniref:Rhodopsin domain-containing protein n=1 Tax=Fusarium sarcochroum TaxID=1208366 RepID=A0A8H4WPP1_9HYPO|nr:hypothetical protein FSARC_14447 [Fusarium sarcochroum]
MSSSSSPSSTPAFSPEYVRHDEGANLVGVSIAMMPFTVIIVGLRLWCRKKKKTPIGWDDWMSVISLPFLWALAVLGILSVYTGGVGRHLPVVLKEDPDMLGRSLFCLFLGEIAYGTALFTVKQSILLLYQRIFPTRFMRVAGFLLGGLSAAWWLVVVFISVFQCTPIKKMWHPFMEEGKCLDSNKFFLGNLIPNIIIDVLILALPVYEVLRLQIRRAQKIAIASIFLLGGLVVIISCIRLTAIIDFITIGPDGDVTCITRWALLDLDHG